MEIVGHDEWIEARSALLAREKELTRLRDELSRQQRALPWERVEQEYVFDTPEGKQTLADLFDGRSQLVVYHFMFPPEDGEGCPSCSFWADSFDANVVHLNARDVTFVAISRAPLEKLTAYRDRLGWSFEWVSSGHNRFNYDFGASFDLEEQGDRSRLDRRGRYRGAPAHRARPRRQFWRCRQNRRARDRAWGNRRRRRDSVRAVG